MRTSAVFVASLAVAASTANAGFLDKLRPAGASPSSAVDAALPVPPAEPSLAGHDPFAAGNAETTTTVIVAATPIPGGPSVARGQGAAETIPAGSGSAKTAPASTAPQNVQEPYTGLEYRWKSIRIRPGELKREGLAALLIGAYIAISLLGKRKNQEEALAWWKAHFDILNDNFSSFLSRPGSAALTRLDPNTYVGHGSGRRGTSGLTASISTYPRHDIAQLVYYLGNKLYDLTWVPSANSVVLSFELPTLENAKNQEDFVFAIVAKNQMQQVKDRRWDLSAFASSVAERPDVLKGDEFVVFSEGGQLNDWFFKREKVGIKELWASEDPAAKKALGYLQSLIISDLVSERPEESVLDKLGSIPKSRKLVLTMTLPAKSRAEETRPLVELAFNLLDVLAKGGVPSDTLNKSKKRRADIYNLLLSESRKEASEKKLTEARALKKRIEDEKKDKMPLSERRKLEAKEREKEMIKQAKKQQKK